MLTIAIPVVLLLALLSGGRIASAGTPSVTLAIDGDGVGPVSVPSGDSATATISVFTAPGRVYVVGCTSSPCSMANAYSIGSPVVNGVAAGGSTTITFTPIAAYPFYAAILEPQTGRYYSNTIEITSMAPNSPPTANPDFYTVDQDTTVTVLAGSGGVLDNDTDPDSDVLTASLVSTTPNGTLLLGTDGGFTYTPNLGYSGPDSFTYVARDGTVDSNVTTASINVLAAPSPSPSASPSPVNSPPVAIADNYVTNFNTPLNVTAPGVLSNDTDLDGDTLTAELVTSTANGMLTFTFDGGFIYVPNSGYSGPDAFTYAADDGAGIGNVATVTITVLAGPSPSPSASESASPSASASAPPSISPSPSESSSASASASLSASPSASASPSSAVGSPAPDAVVLQAFIEQDDTQIGETVYTDEVTVGTTAAGDRRPATEGELTFVVVDSATNTILDQDSTDADGIVVLDAETGAPFFIYEIAEPDDGFYGSPDYLLVGDETLDVEVIRFVAVQPASASPVASGSASAVASASGDASAVASAAASATATPSAAVSDDGTTMPSAAPAASSGANTLPNTGTGPRSGGAGSLLWLALLGTALALIGAAGLRVRRR